MRDARSLALPADAARALLEIARASLVHGLRHGHPLPVDAAGLADPLDRPAATFVSWRRGGALRGCVGELEPRYALAESVARNAWSAASRDPRFEPIGEDELEALDVHVSVLGPLEPLPVASEAELIAALRPGFDGLLIDDGVRRATFLPAVWESLPDPRRFVRELQRKAGLPERAWPPGLRVWRYAATDVPAPDRG